MRLRRDKNAAPFIEDCNKIIKNPYEYKGKWQELFNNSNPIHVEFGAGKGGFITELSKANPNINYIAVEKAETIVYKALKHASDISDNLYFLYFDVDECINIFEAGEVERIYLNFSDPWHKNRYKKRRLTHRNFLDKYAKILSTAGEIHFKTDNKKLFGFSIEEFSAQNWLLTEVTLDLHKANVDNIMTEYEKKFSEQGLTINRLVATHKQA
ncbi:tRNA (guanosine(46)-N7)-methyltransferase TrmB [Candidatus Epulonipiscium viviparus]|uniref:tRNA (guanosine(46)-N7)-methyltransferase TrmB n=1 Tax=Candidatus Epulonipiscium viviparus TaxID=420336 RepID=UPI00273813BF|nr:tRNA (guanosine(46)-N7)-methyltransferase TrmB [Candidatus Epulopiscium viviparus]